MKIQIDDISKTITFLNDIKLSDMIDLLNRLFPENEWKNYTLAENKVYPFTSPVYIPYWQELPLYPSKPYYLNCNAVATDGVITIEC